VIADNRANLLRKRCGSFGNRQVRFHCIRAATRRASLVDYGGGLRGSTAVVNDYLRTDSGKSLSGSATNAA
jgi:hypothetical protein